MPRATTTERRRSMKRTRNGILIPDVPIMAGGNLPNAVKGVSGDNGKFDPLDPSTPIYIEVLSSLHINQSLTGNLQISDDNKNWMVVVNGMTLNAGRYFLRDNNSGQIRLPIIKQSGENFNIGGNVNSLASHNFAEDIAVHNFRSFCENGNVVDATYLVFPALNLSAANCYINAFKGSLIENPPIIRAERLGHGCCYGMFSNCTKLKSSPILLAKSSFRECYYEMFSGCTSLSRIECHLEDLTAVSALTNFSANVAATGTFIKKRGVTWPSGANGIPAGWTVEEVD